MAQVALTQVSSGDTRVENLAPGESRFVAMPFNGFPGQETAYVTIGTTTGFQSSYLVDLQQPPLTPLPAPDED